MAWTNIYPDERYEPADLIEVEPAPPVEDLAIVGGVVFWSAAMVDSDCEDD